jgi:acyl-homoserine lactone acylase PvdQ
MRLIAGMLALALLLAAPVGAQVQPYGTNDAGGFRNVLPPGTNGLDNALQLGAFEATKARPAHSDDQLAMYSNLTTAAPGIRPDQLGQFYKDATFGVPSGQVESTTTPEPGVTIIRDTSFGVPHVYGDTRAGLMFGTGFASAQDRLFFIDALRHAGRGELASFAGGANAAMDASVWAGEPYNESDLTAQLQYIRTHLLDGQQIYDDIVNYVAGINAYITQAKLNPLMEPAEYAALGIVGGPQPFKPEDLVAIATLVGGIFGVGGGQQLANAQLYQAMLHRFGPEHVAAAGSPELPPPAARPRGKRTVHPRPKADHSGYASFLSFVDPADPEAPSTVSRRSFRYLPLPAPSRAVRATIALPDRGSVQPANPVAGGAVPAARDSARSTLNLPATIRRAGLLAFPRGMSNALLVSARRSVSGHALAVMGPQVSYYSPQILMEEDLHGPGIDAAGAAFPGVNLYVELGHGRDYAWSATSSGQQIVDTFAVPLCNPAGGAPALSSDHYLLHGACVGMETLTRSESWQPNLADSTPAGSVTLRTQRTAYGLVIARARVHGRAVAYTNLRSTYMHELDSAVGFERFNEPAVIRNPQQYFNAAYQIGYTFNWFYADDKHIGYFNSGHNPLRARHTDPLFPSWAADGWSGTQPSATVTPSSTVSAQTPQRQHPQVIDQDVLTSWNNKQAPGYNDPATAQEFSSIYRSQLLDQNISHALAAGRGKLTLTDLVNAMGNAGTQDLRGVQVLPYLLRVIGHPSDPALAGAVTELTAWMRSGAHRINRAHPGTSGSYEQGDAIRIMDAWWPLLVRAEFGPMLGSSLLGHVESDFPINDEPGHGTSGEHLGSAWDVGFYGIVQKDLRAALRRRVRGALNRVYCGSGSLRACRGALDSSLKAAIATPATAIYPKDKVCAAGDQMCSDAIELKPISAITQPLIEWINRPTFQQAVEIQGHGPR